MNTGNKKDVLKAIDSHCHLLDDQFTPDRKEVISSTLENLDGIVIIIEEPFNVSPDNLVNCKKIRYAVGFHPYYAEHINKELDLLTEFLENPNVCAIGEIGLDYFHCTLEKEIQKKAFIKQVEFAQEKNLPIVVHCRNAEIDTYEILKGYAPHLSAIILHCYGGNEKMVEPFLSINCMISFAGNVTYPKAKELHESARLVPLGALLIETDAPYLAPQPVRGKRCIPEYVIYTAQKIAEIKNVDVQTIIEATHKNTSKVFGF